MANDVGPRHDIDGPGTSDYGYGDSYILNPNGEVVAAAGLDHEYLVIYNLDLEKMHHIQHNQRSLKSGKDLLGILSDTLTSTKD